MWWFTYNTQEAEAGELLQEQENYGPHSEF